MSRKAGSGLSRNAGEKARQPRGDRRRLFLLHPVAGAVDELDAFELWTGAFHRVDAACALIDAPVALPRQEQRANIDRPSREQLELRRESRHAPDAIRLQAALEAVAPVFAAIHAQLFVGQP